MKYNLTSEIKIDSYRESCPWIDNDHLEWTSQLLRSAVVWLSETVGKSILRLTDDDYRENSLGQLLNIYGSSYDMNIRVFNELQRTITGLAWRQSPMPTIPTVLRGPRLIPSG